MSDSIAKVIETKLTALNDLATQINGLAVQLKENESKLTSSVNSAVSLIKQLKSKQNSKDLSDPEFREKITSLLDKLEGELNSISSSLNENPDAKTVNDTVKSLHDLLQPKEKTTSDDIVEKNVETDSKPKDEGLINTIKKAIGLGDKEEEVKDDASKVIEEVKDDSSKDIEDVKDDASKVIEEVKDDASKEQGENLSAIEVITKATAARSQQGGYRYSSKRSTKRVQNTKRSHTKKSFSRTKGRKKLKSRSKRKTRRSSFTKKLPLTRKR